MTTVDPGLQAARAPAPEAEGGGWLLFAGIMMMVVAILNVIYGIAAIGNATFFVNDAKFILSDLKTWGWVTVVIGGIQGLAAFSIWRGAQFGRWLGILMACLSLIAALLSIPAYPFWSLAIVAVDVLIIYGLAAYGGRHVSI